MMEGEIQTLGLHVFLEEHAVKCKGKKVQELQEKYAQESKEAASYYVRLASQTSEILRLKEHLATQQVQNGALEQELQEMKRKTSSISFRGIDLRKMTELEKENTNLKSALEQGQTSRQNLEVEIAKLSHVFQQNANLTATLGEEQVRRQSLEAEVAKLNSELQQSTHLRGLLGKEQVKKQSLQKEVIRLNHEVQALKQTPFYQQYHQLQQQMDGLRQRHDQLNQEYLAWKQFAEQRDGKYNHKYLEVEFMKYHLGQGDANAKEIKARAMFLEATITPTTPNGQQLIDLLQDVIKQANCILDFNEYVLGRFT